MGQEIGNYKFEPEDSLIKKYGPRFNFVYLKTLVFPVIIFSYFVHEKLGCWIRNNCFDEVVESFYLSIKQNLNDIINLSKDKYKEFKTNLKDYLIQLKETSSKITLLHKILNNYERKNIESIKETPEELIKKALKDLEEEDKIKDIFEKVIHYQK